VFRRGALDAPRMFKRPDRIPKLGRRMFGNELILIINLPGSIEELSNFDVCLGIGASVGTRRQIQNQTSNPNAVIIAHDRAIAEADDSIQIELWGKLAPGFFGFSGGDCKATIKPWDKDFEKAIRCFKALDSFKTHLSDEAVLQGPKESFNSPFGLWGEGRDGLNAQGLQR
jgi:hypothetical protein